MNMRVSCRESSSSIVLKRCVTTWSSTSDDADDEGREDDGEEEEIEGGVLSSFRCGIHSWAPLPLRLCVSSGCVEVGVAAAAAVVVVVVDAAVAFAALPSSEASRSSEALPTPKPVAATSEGEGEGGDAHHRRLLGKLRSAMRAAAWSTGRGGCGCGGLESRLCAVAAVCQADVTHGACGCRAGARTAPAFTAFTQRQDGGDAIAMARAATPPTHASQLCRQSQLRAERRVNPRLLDTAGPVCGDGIQGGRKYGVEAIKTSIVFISSVSTRHHV